MARPAAFYPAPGFRHANLGTLEAVGNNGFNWSSSLPASTALNYRALHLEFHSAGIDPNSYYYRSNGFPLRCLQE
ncbi:MAG: hypothetical protein K2K83_04150 [Rikenella sp.]|nr:hypothetical protein [Rikenella sp.]